MTLWECTSLSVLYASDIDERATELGKQGWELINVVRQDCGYVAFFKRPVSDDRRETA